MKKVVIRLGIILGLCQNSFAMPGDIPSSWGLQCKTAKTGVESMQSLLDSLDFGRAEMPNIGDIRLSGLRKQKSGSVVLENDRTTQVCVDIDVSSSCSQLCGEGKTAAIAVDSLNYKITKLPKHNLRMGNLRFEQKALNTRYTEYTSCVLRSDIAADSISDIFQSNVPVVKP